MLAIVCILRALISREMRLIMMIIMIMQMTPPREVWFISLVWTELLLQLPFFFFATYAFIMKHGWIRIPSIAYGSFVCATMVPILATLMSHRGPGYCPMTALMYVPYAVLPALLVFTMGRSSDPFGKIQQGSKNKREWEYFSNVLFYGSIFYSSHALHIIWFALENNTSQLFCHSFCLINGMPL